MHRQVGQVGCGRYKLGTSKMQDVLPKINTGKVHIFRESLKILQNLHQLFVLCTASQIIGGDFAKFCGLLRIYEL